MRPGGHSAKGSRLQPQARPGPWKVSSTRTRNTRLRSIDEQVTQRRADRESAVSTDAQKKEPLRQLRGPEQPATDGARRREPHATTLRDMAHITLQVVHRSTIPEYCRQCLIKGKPSRPVTQVTR